MQLADVVNIGGIEIICNCAYLNVLYEGAYGRPLGPYLTLDVWNCLFENENWLALFWDLGEVLTVSDVASTRCAPFLNRFRDWEYIGVL